jgi:hypothetical protein
MPAKKSDDPLTTFPVRLPASLVERLRGEAVEHGCTNSDVFRRYLSLADAKPLNKPRPVRAPKYTGRVNHADPKLMFAIAQIGNNLNQLARSVNGSSMKKEPIELIQVLSVLISIERALTEIGAQNAS